MNGKLNVQISNEDNLANVDMYVYVELKAGRVYTSISKVQGPIGYQLQMVAFVTGTTVSWLFALPTENSINGFDLTGGVFNRTVELSFPTTGHQVVINEQYFGRNVFQMLNFRVDVKGTLPPIAANISMRDFTQEMIQTSPGLIKSRFTHGYQLGEDNPEKFEIIMDSTIRFEECAHRPLAIDSTPKLHLHSDRNFITFDDTHETTRYVSDSKISYVTGNVLIIPINDTTLLFNLHRTQQLS